MTDSTYIPGLVYNNLVLMLGYRKAAITSPILQHKELIEQLNHSDYVTIRGKRGDASDPRGAAEIVVVLMAPKSKYAAASADFKKLFNNQPKAKNKTTNMIFITEVPLVARMKKIVAGLRRDNPSIIIESYDYSLFLIETPKHESVPVHVIATTEEIKEFCRQHWGNANLKMDKFPKILQADPQAVWLGLMPGMYVKILGPSETAGRFVSYRVCV